MRIKITLAACLLLTNLAAAMDAAEHGLFWTPGDRLLPAWGFYPNGSSYGDTAPADKASAWTAGGGTHTLTWVADFPAAAPWQVWVRQYGGYGKVTAAVDERPVTDGRGGPGGGRYVWRHLGEITVAAGSHHVDVTVTHGMLDAVLFATDPAFDPAQAKLPEPVENPVLRGLRAYRNDRHLSAAAASTGFVVGRVVPYTEPAHAVSYPDESGQPIPTLRWEAMRDGIDDVRYLQTLDRAIAAAETRLSQANPPATLAPALDRARHVRKDSFEAISGRWFQYLGGLVPGALDDARRRMADAAIDITLAGR